MTYNTILTFCEKFKEGTKYSIIEEGITYTITSLDVFSYKVSWFIDGKEYISDPMSKRNLTEAYNQGKILLIDKNYNYYDKYRRKLG